jgi:hypothetical protein
VARYVATLAAAWLVAACAADPVDRHADLDAVPDASLVEITRLGGINAPEEVSFRVEPQVRVSPAGDVYVLHAQRGQVAVLDSTGRLRHWIGRRGAGPGEFEVAVAMGFVGDTLWVRNAPSPQISRFLADGSRLGTERTSWDYGHFMSTPSGVSGYLAHDRAWIEPAGIVVGGAGAVQLPVLLGDRGLTALDTPSLSRIRADDWPASPSPPSPCRRSTT